MRHAVGSASLLLLALFSGGGGGAGAERSAQSLGEMPGPTVACSPARVHAILAAVASANRAGVAVRGLLHPRLRAGQIGIRLRGGSEAVGDSEAGEQDEFRPRAFDDDPGSIVREDQSDEEEMPEQGLDDDEEEEEEEGQGQGRGTNDFNDINAMQDDYWRDQIEMIKEQDAANDDFW
ncbi:hypothetical protein T484DRAFT_1821739 [Baffinella frigidus]|nr:hypothetical protein T484DRAFT_1821739 [Cryptophyta sp. CCMP2293]